MGSFLEFLVIGVAAALFLIGAFLLRQRWTRRPTRLRRLLQRESPGPRAGEEALVTLLVYEDDVPSFLEILGLVLEKYPLSRFLKDADFREALTFLDRSVYERPEPVQLRAAMSQIVHVFLADPDVEYHFRSHLATLVDTFLKELDAFEDRIAGS